MELWLLKLAGFLRPVGSIDYLEAIFEVAGIAMFAMILAGFLVRAAVKGTIELTGIDLLMLAFTAWCASLYVIYPDTPRVRALSDLAKATIPLLSYIVVHNIVRTRDEYRRLLFWIVIGFSIPVLLSLVVIVLGGGVYWVSYWTGLPRWGGAYLGPHSMGHSMTLFLMTLVIYAYFLRLHMLPHGGLHRWQSLALVGISGAAMACLILSQVRSAMLGLLCFAAVALAMFNRKLLILAAVGATLAAAATVPYWLTWVAPEVIVLEEGQGDLMDLGSSRPKYWLHNLSIYAELPLDRKIGGTGLASRAKSMYVEEDQVLDSHNDWLDLLMQTGAIGLLLYLTIQYLMLRSALRLQGVERCLFVALVAAVGVMMFVSNSYVWRIQVAHIYFILAAYVQLHAAREERRTGEPLRAGPLPALSRWPRTRGAGTPRVILKKSGKTAS